MSADKEVLAALHESILELEQPTELENVLAAWLNAMSESEIGQNDHKRYLEATKHAMNKNVEDGA
jgi:hypothetical protein